MNTTPEERKIDKDELSHRFYKSIELLKEFRSTFLRWAIVESEGILPSTFLEHDVSELKGVEGLLTVWSHGHKYSCRFKPRFEGEEKCWTSSEPYCLDEYERKLFSTWSYDIGFALDRQEMSEAVWYIDDQSTANRLEDIAGRIDEMLNTITEPKSLAFVAVRTIGTVKNHKPKWKPGRVDWSYIKELDERLRGLELVYKKLSTSTETEQNSIFAKLRRIWTCIKRIPRRIYVLVLFLAALLTCIYFLWWLWTTLWKK